MPKRTSPVPGLTWQRIHCSAASGPFRKTESAATAAAAAGTAEPTRNCDTSGGDRTTIYNVAMYKVLRRENF